MSAARYALRIVVLGIMLACGCVSVSFAQVQNTPADGAKGPEDLAPDSAYISPTKYTNAFFGFSMELPRELQWGTLSENYGKNDSYFLCGALVMRATKLTMVSAMARKPEGDIDDAARKAVTRGFAKPPREVEIAGKKFWVAEEELKKNGTTMWHVDYATPLDGSVLQIDIFSGDSKLAREIQRSVGEIKFFDPAKAAEMAGPDSKPFLTTRAQMAKAKEQLDELDMGSVTGNVYENDELGFASELPTGWIANDKATTDRAVEEGHQKAYGNQVWAAREHEMMKECTRTVLAATKYPVGSAQFENSPDKELIYIMVLDPACMPRAKFPTSVADREALRRMAESELLVLTRWRGTSDVKPAVDGFEVQGHLMVQLSESVPFRSEGNSHSDKEVFMAHEITQLKGYWVAWNFMATSEAEIDAMLKTRIKFEDAVAAQGAPAAQSAQPAAAAQPKR